MINNAWKHELEKYFDKKIQPGHVCTSLLPLTVQVDGQGIEVSKGSLFDFSQDGIVSIRESIQETEKYHINLSSVSLITPNLVPRVTLAFSAAQKPDTIRFIHWDSRLPLVLPSIGDQAKVIGELSGIVESRSFNYDGADDHLTVEIKLF